MKNLHISRQLYAEEALRASGWKNKSGFISKVKILQISAPVYIGADPGFNIKRGDNIRFAKFSTKTLHEIERGQFSVFVKMLNILMSGLIRWIWATATKATKAILNVKVVWPSHYCAWVSYIIPSLNNCTLQLTSDHEPVCVWCIFLGINSRITQYPPCLSIISRQLTSSHVN